MNLGSKLLDDMSGFYSSKNKSLRVDAPDSSTTYVGWAETGSSESAAKWRIMKVSVSGNITSITWADSNINFDNVWNNRVSLTYG